MASEEYELDELPRRAGGRTRSNAAGRRAAQQLIQRLAWTEWPLVFRAPPLVSTPGAPDARVIPAGHESVLPLLRRLRNLAVGAYAIEFVAGGAAGEATGISDDAGDSLKARPKVLQVTPVNDALIASALRRLLETRRFPKWMPDLVGDVVAWTSRVERQVALARLAIGEDALGANRNDNAAGLIAARTGATDRRSRKRSGVQNQSITDPLAALAIEAACLWLGTDESRPSNSLDAAAVLRRLLAGKGDASLLEGAAAVLIGLRGVSRQLPRGLEPWRACGAMLRGWPLDLIVHAARLLGSPALLAETAAAAGVTAEPALVPVIRELLLDRADADGLVAGIKMVGVLAVGADRLRQEVDRRFGRLAEAQRTAIECGQVASDWRPRQPPGPERARREKIFLGAYEASVAVASTAAATSHVDTVLPQPRRVRREQREQQKKGERQFPAAMMVAVELCRLMLGDDAALIRASRVGVKPASPGDAGAARLSDRAAKLVFAAAEASRVGTDALRTRRLTALAIRLHRAGLARSCEQWACAWRAWADAACTLVRPGPRGQSQWQVMAGGFLHLGAAGVKSANPAAYWRAVESHAVDILECAARQSYAGSPPHDAPRISTQMDEVAVIVALGVEADAGSQVSQVDTVAAALSGNWVHLLVAMRKAPPERVRLALKWLGQVSEQRERPDRQPSRWLPAEPWALHRMGRLFALADLGLLRRLTARIVPPWFGPRVAAIALSELIAFLEPPATEEDSAGQRRQDGSRVEFLRQQRLLRSHPFLLEGLIGRDGEPAPDTDAFPLYWPDRCRVVAAWQDRGWPGLPELWDAMARRAFRRTEGANDAVQDPERPFNHVETEERDPLLAIARGEVRRAMVLVYSNPGLAYQEWSAAGRGWAWISRDDRLARALSPLVEQPATFVRLLRCLVRVELCLRLPDAAALAAELARLADAVEPVTTNDQSRMASAAQALPVPSELPMDLAEQLRSIGALNGGELPKRIRDILDRAARLRSELAALDARVTLDGPAARRRENVARYLQEPQRLADWIATDLRKSLPSLRDELLLSAAERAAERPIARHISRLLGTAGGASVVSGRDWDNAVRLYFTIEKNRALLLRLMRRRAAADRDWIERHPPNRRFLDAMAARGIDIAAWRGSYREVFSTRVGPLTVELEDDPLHVLQMGNYFDTCLAEGGVNSFSTVANAWEANKRVAYVRDADGRVVGRKLLVMTPAGRIAGFRSYGTGQLESWEGWNAEGKSSPWVKIVLDAFSRGLADRCRAQLHPYPDAVADDSVDDDKRFKLFAAWYHDGCEEFDRWWTRHGPGEIRAGAAAGGALRDQLASDLRCDVQSADQPSYEQKCKFVEALRVTLWLGDDALPVLERLSAADGVPRPVVECLLRHSAASRLRMWLGAE